MSEKELFKKYEEERRACYPAEYNIFMMIYLGYWVPLLTALFAFLAKGKNTVSLLIVIICAAVFLVMGIAAVVIYLRHIRGWKKYHGEYMSKLADS